MPKHFSIIERVPPKKTAGMCRVNCFLLLLVRLLFCLALRIYIALHVFNSLAYVFKILLLFGHFGYSAYLGYTGIPVIIFPDLGRHNPHYLAGNSSASQSDTQGTQSPIHHMESSRRRLEREALPLGKFVLTEHNGGFGRFASLV